MKRHGVVLFALLFCLVARFPAAQEKPAAPPAPPIQEEVTVRWWLVPVYAVDKAGGAVLDLAPEDLDVYIKGIKVERFSLIKKRFQVTESGARPTPAPSPPGPAQKKMVFFVFDAAFSPFNLLAKARAIADRVIAQSDKSAQYVLMTIEPFSGLKYVFGPTRDLDSFSKSMKRFVEGKKQDYMLETSASGNRDINNAYPAGSSRNPEFLGGTQRRLGGGRVYNGGGVGKNNWLDVRRVASTYMSSLLTLNLVLENFREYSKVIYLYSCGIPGDALMDGVGAPSGGLYLFADRGSYDSLKTIGEYFNKNGGLLFLVNPEGTRVAEADKDSGEQSLRILANESGGRYFEGADQDIARDVNNMEGGYYEISFPDKPEYAGRELSFEIRSRKPEVSIFTVRKVGREKAYADMTELEKEILILNILNEGPYARAMHKVVFVEAQTFLDGNSLVCQVPLPAELARSAWSIYKICRNFQTGSIQIEKDDVVSESPTFEVRMGWKGKDFRHDIVLVHPATGTILVWK